MCRKELKPVTLILAAKVHPDVFITEDSYRVISQYIKFKRYGISFLYPKGVNDIPHGMMQGLEIISGIVEQDEADRVKEATDKK